MNESKQKDPIGSDPAKFFQDGLSHSEMLKATGLTAENVMNWYKRDLLPKDFERSPGRGNRRRYSVEAAKFLSMLGALTDAGVVISGAIPLAKLFLTSFFGGPFDLIKALRAPADPVLLIRSNYGEYAVDPLPNDTQSVTELRQLMRNRKLRSGIIFDVNSAYLDFYDRLAEVLAERK